jgi:predicted Zn-dependent protease
LLNDNDIRNIIDAALAGSRAGETEITIFEGDTALTRFANNEIHQNVAEHDASLLVRVALGKKVGVASLNRADVAGARLAAERALELARYQVDNPDFVGMPSPAPAARLTGVAVGTLRYGPDRRAKGVEAVVRRAMENGLVAAGAFSTGVNRVTIGNSHGVFQQHESTDANLNTVVMSATSAGYGDHTARDAEEIDADAVGERAVRKAVDGRDPRSLGPGEYTVVLEEPAVNDILDFLAYEGFGAQAVEEGRSFMAGHLGQRVVGENISIWDDGLAADTIGMPFDYEGVPRRRVDLITKGVAVGPVYDSATAAKAGTASTGHALPAGSTFGPLPMHLHLAPGEVSYGDLIAGVKRGVLVTRFWYTRTVHPLTVTVTGMTRDGTFLIEDGRVVGPVRNLRFTQSYLEALKQVEAIGRDTKLQREFGGGNRVPAMRIGGWTFTGGTEY